MKENNGQYKNPDLAVGIDRECCKQFRFDLSLSVNKKTQLTIIPQTQTKQSYETTAIPQISRSGREITA